MLLVCKLSLCLDLYSCFFHLGLIELSCCFSCFDGMFNTSATNRQQIGRVKFYSCGPTVYDMAHIGNFRAFLTYDVLKRWLLLEG